MAHEDVIASMNRIEKSVLFALYALCGSAAGKHVTAASVMQRAGMQEIEVLRGFGWLANKGLVETEESEHEQVRLGKNGILYKAEGLPERRCVAALEKGTLDSAQLMKMAGLQPEELNICIGMLKKKSAIEIGKEINKDKGAALMLSLTPAGHELLRKEMDEEIFLKKDFPLSMSTLDEHDKAALGSLRQRKEIVSIEKRKAISAALTRVGSDVAKSIASEPSSAKDIIEKLTPEIIKSASYEGRQFRKYDISAEVPKINSLAGRRHYVNDAIEYVKKIWLELGFEEMTGPIVQTSLWNFDALFTAQDHPVREMQDTFFIKNPQKGTLPKNAITEHIKATHENGWTTGSLGWRYRWDEEEAKKNVLRTHTTVLSARTIAALKEGDLPKKYFSLGRCYRNEALDDTHLFEFHQIEGIVVDEHANFRHLLGYLEEFFKKMGYEKVRIRPAYFPYTEPSAEVEGYDPKKKKWIELGGSGMFRPEVVKPLLGKDVPVLAWGMGFERIIRTYYGMSDIRDVYRNDLKQLREVKAWML